MKTYFFDMSTGRIRPSWMSGPDDVVRANTPAGHAPITGVTDPLRQRVDVSVTPPMLVAWEPPPEDVAAQIRRDVEARIDAIERRYMLPRPVRDLILSSSLTGPGRDEVQRIEDQIVALRARLTEDTQ